MIRALLLTVIFIAPISSAYAECPELAQMFANNPDSMEANDLGSLKRCVTNKLREKLFSNRPTTIPMPAPAPPPPMPAPPIMPVPSR